MSTPVQCPQCGAALPEGILQGLCLRCLARQAGGILAARSASILNPQPSTSLRCFGDYELLEEIARGGMGVVWKARQLSLNRTVAVKMLLAGKFSSPEFVQRFRAEAEAAANLQHPNIVAIHEVGEHEDQQYFSMDYVEGRNLAQLAREQPLPAHRAAAYVKTVAEAVHYAHQRGVLHRDLKPANILIDSEDEPRVTDFGLAKRIEVAQASPPASSGGVPAARLDFGRGRPENSQAGTPALHDLTLTGQVLGTPGFMSPEQAGGRRGVMSPASDVYSLGAVLYFLVTGRAPFAAGSLEETLRQIHEAEPVSPRLLNPALPRDLETICLKALSKEPARRYTTAQALAEDLERFLSDETIVARPARAPEKLWRWCRRKPALATLMLALLVVGTTGLIGILWQWRRAEEHGARETIQRLRAEEAVTMLELQRAEDLLEKDDVIMGVTYLARMVRQQPTNQITARRLLSALTQRNFALPVGLPLQHARKVCYAEFSPDGQRVVTAALDFNARVWDARTGEPVTPPMFHPEGVRKAYFSPDGTRVVTLTHDPEARLWDAATGRAIGQSLAHAKRARSAQFSPDSRRVLTASEDGTAQLWDAQTGKPALEPLNHQGPVRMARFSPDGNRIATASEDGTARLWDALTGRPVGKPLRHSTGLSGAEFSPDGKRLVTRVLDFSTCLWDAATGEQLSKPLFHAAEAYAARFSPDGERVIVALHNGLTRIFSARDWTPLTPPMQHSSWATDGDFSPEGQRVLTGSIDGTARLWDAHTGEPLTAPMQHEVGIWSARFSPDGLFAVTASGDGTARIWDVRLGAARSTVLKHDSPISLAEFSPDGDWIVTGCERGLSRIWNSRTGEPHALLREHWGRIAAVKFSSDGRHLATASHDGTARIWDIRTGRPFTEPFVHGRQVDLLDLSLDGRLLATGSRLTNMVRLWDTRTGRPHREPITLRTRPVLVRFSPDGQRLLLSDYRADRLQLYDVASGQLLAQTLEREGAVMYGEFSPDGQRVLTASSPDDTARIWDGRTLQPLGEPMRHKGSLLHARFSRDGRRVVTATESGIAQVWDAQTCQPVGEMMRHRNWVKEAEFSPDGTLVLTASYDGTARLWDALSGRPVAEPFRHDGRVHSAHFSPDSRRVLTVSRSGSAHLWDVPPAIPPQSRFNSAATIQEHEPADTLLADLADAVIGKRVNAQGALESVSGDALIRARKAAARLPRDAEFTHWLDWFLADRSTRTISPGSPVSLPDYVLAGAQETNEASWRQTLMLCPTNGLAFAQMARHHLQRSKGANSLDAALADWASRQAVKFATEHSQPWQRRIEVMEHTGGWTQLMAEAEQVIQSKPANACAWITKSRCLTELGQFEAVAQPYNAVFWNAKGLLHEKAGQIQQAEASFARALEVASLPVVSWDFESERTSPNWKVIDQMTNIRVERGNLSFDSTGEDPHLELYLPPVDGSVYRWLHVRMKNATSAERAEVFWGSVTNPRFDQATAVRFPILPDDRQFTVYTVDMGHRAWTKNHIAHLRFDPANRPGHIDIDWICLHTDSKPPADVSGWGEIANPEMRRQALSNLVRLRSR